MKASPLGRGGGGRVPRSEYYELWGFAAKPTERVSPLTCFAGALPKGEPLFFLFSKVFEVLVRVRGQRPRRIPRAKPMASLSLNRRRSRRLAVSLSDSRPTFRFAKTANCTLRIQNLGSSRRRPLQRWSFFFLVKFLKFQETFFKKFLGRVRRQRPWRVPRAKRIYL